MAKFSWGPSGSQQTINCVELVLSGCLGGESSLGGASTIISGSTTVEIKAPVNKATALTIGTSDNTYVTINDAIEYWIFWNKVLMYDDVKLSFGAPGDADSYIEYSSAIDKLIISGSDSGIEVSGSTIFANDVQIVGNLYGGSPLQISGGCDLGGDLTLGTDCNSTVTVSGNLTALCNIYQSGGTDSFYVPDGDASAFTISAVGDTDQGAPVDGLYLGVNTAFKKLRTSTDFIIDHNKKLWLGTGSLLTSGQGQGNGYISWAAGENRLIIESTSGSTSGINLSGTITANEIASGSIAGAGSYVGVNSQGQLVLTASSGGGGGTPGGTDTQIQFNDGGSSFGAEPNLTYDKAQSRFFVSGTTLLTGSVNMSGSTAIGLAPYANPGENDGVVLRVEGGAVNQNQGKTVLMCQVTGSNSGDVGYVGIGTTSPKVTLDVRWNPDLDDNAGGGDVVSFGNDTGLLSGAIYYLHSSGQWMSASADATGSGASQLLAIALGASVQGSEGDAGGMLIRGWVNTTRFNGDFIQGGAVYIESGSGGGFMSGAAPTAADSYVRIVGYSATNANMIYFNPGTSWVELS